MQLFVDYIDLAGMYRSARASCTVDPALPVGVLTAVVFLSAVGQTAQAFDRRVFHVESGRFLSEPQLDDAGVGDLDTLIVVNSDETLWSAPHALLTRWHARGGSTRRCLHTATAAPASHMS